MQAGHARHLCLSLRGSVEDGNLGYAMLIFYDLILFPLFMIVICNKYLSIIVCNNFSI
jgi:hypothetical protein